MVTNYVARIGFIILAFSLSVPFVSSQDLGLSASGAIYYVSPSGSDANPGTETQPWQTIQKATETLVAGDTVYIKAGTYPERVIPQNSGSTGNYITYAAYASDTVTIDGSSVTLPSDWGGLFDVSNKSYITISGLRIENAGPNDNNVGILADNASYITIEKNYIYDTVSSGIGVWNSDNIIINGNEVELACNDGEQECITVAATDTFEIKNNHVHDGGPGTLGGEGIDTKDGSSNGKVYKNLVDNLPNRVGIYVDAWDKHTYNIDVFQNIVHDCGADGFDVASEAGGLLENVRIYNNIAYNNKYNGITIANWGEPVPEHPLKDIKVINNTFYNNGQGSWGGGINIENPVAQNVVIRNNICSQNLSFQIVAEPNVPTKNLTVDHNLIDGYRGYDGEMYGSDYVEDFPRFVDPFGADFHLQSTSPAIDKGSSVDAPIDDYDGTPRPQMTGHDIGAYEYVPGGITTTTTASGTTTSTLAPSTTTTTTEEGCSLENIYGEYSEEAELLRYFRDKVLSQTPEGQEIIRLYYEWSPLIVKAIAEDEGFKEEVKETIDGFLPLIREEVPG